MDEDFKKDKAREFFDKIENGKSVKIIESNNRTPLPPNIMMFQTLAYLSAKKMTPGACRVMLLFLSVSQYENAVSMDIKTIIEELKMSKSTVVRATNELEKNGIIIKVKYLKDRRRKEYFINPIAAWKGNSRSRLKFMEKMDPDQLKLFDVDYNDHVRRENKEIKDKCPLMEAVVIDDKINPNQDF